MLQSIRDRTHGWIAGIIISLIILSFALWGIHSYIEGAGNSDVVAKVNGIEISKQQLAIAYGPMRNQVQASMGTSILPERIESLLKRRALQNLINVQVLKQASLAQHFRVSELQIENYLQRMPEFQVDGRFSLDRFKQLLANNNISVGDFFQMLNTTMLIDQPKAGIVLTSFSLPEEIKNSIALLNQERNISYGILPFNSALNNQIQVSQTEIADYYKNHKDEFKVPEQVSIEYVELSAKDLLNTIHPNDNELKSFYNANINNYTTPTEWKLLKLLVPVSEKTTLDEIKKAQDKIAEIQKKLNAGADFTKLAHEFPADNSDQWVTLNQLPRELHQAVSSLTQKGQVSEPVKVNKGLMLLKVVDIKPTKTLSYEEVKDKVHEAFVAQLSQEKFAEAKEKLASLSYEHADSLTPTAKALNLPIKSSQVFSQTKPGIDISKDQRIRDAAFNSEVLNSQNNSDPIQLDPNTVVVLRVKTHIPASALSLEAVNKDIVERIRKDKAERNIELISQEIKKKLDKGESASAVAAEYHFQWKQVGFINRHAKNIEAAIVSTAFKMPRLKSGESASYATTSVPTGYAIVSLHDIKDGNVNPDTAKQFSQQLANAEGVLEYRLYVESLTNAAKIKLVGDYQDK